MPRCPLICRDVGWFRRDVYGHLPAVRKFAAKLPDFEAKRDDFAADFVPLNRGIAKRLNLDSLFADCFNRPTMSLTPARRSASAAAWRVRAHHHAVS